MMSLYQWDNWPNFFPVSFHRLPEREHMLVLESEDFRVYSSPVRHIIPTIGLRMETADGGRAVVYSGDTEPCEAVIRLAGGAAVLIHEASGGGVGHSTAEQAGQVARTAEVGRLMLIHYPGGALSDGLVEQARAVFPGPVELSQDFTEVEL